MQRWIADTALLPDGFARDVAIDVDGGTVTAVQVGADAAGRERLNGIVVPAMPNLHSHAFQRGMAGLAETRGPVGDSFWTWRKVMYHFLEELTPDDVQAITAYAFMEMLEGGYGSVGEFHYLHNDAAGQAYAQPEELALRVVAAAEATGISLTLLPCFYAYGGIGGAPAEHGQRRFIKTVDTFCSMVDNVRPVLAKTAGANLGVAPHSLRAVTPETLAPLLAAFPEGPVHMHASEQVKEVEDCVAWSGARPVEWLLANAEVNDRWCFIHATHVTDAEVQGIARTGAAVGLCPLTEASLGDGIYPATLYRQAGGHFGIGTDSNIEIDAASELKQLEYSQRLQARSRNVLADEEGQSVGLWLYRAALRGGARALGRAEPTIESGKPADFLVLSMPDAPTPKGGMGLDPFVFSWGRRAIDRVFARGEEVVTGGRHHKRDDILTAYRKVIARLVDA